jgi:hypothetical protein
LVFVNTARGDKIQVILTGAVSPLAEAGGPEFARILVWSATPIVTPIDGKTSYRFR